MTVYINIYIYIFFFFNYMSLSVISSVRTFHFTIYHYEMSDSKFPTLSLASSVMNWACQIAQSEQFPVVMIHFNQVLK